jgi:hypothetical protein
MSKPVGVVASVGTGVEDIVAGKRLDYRAGPYHEDEGDGTLPPAWDVDVESYAVGYEPVGATSVGTASERTRHTRFSYLRTPADKLFKLNEGRHPSDGTLGARLARLDKKRITQAYCSELDVTAFQRDEAVRAMLLLDLDAFGQQKQIEKVALTVIRTVVNYNRLSHLRKLDAERISETAAFKRLAESVGLDTRTMTRLSTRIKDQLSEIEFFERDLEQAAMDRIQFQSGGDRERAVGEHWPERPATE